MVEKNKFEISNDVKKEVVRVINEKSCGTIIIDNNKVLLVQQKSGIYGFPKGHMEDGETEVETAIRETKEETNLDVVVDETKRFSTSYIIKEKINKTVVYYVASPSSKNVKAQESEINEVIWVNIDDVIDKLSFDNLKSLWKEVLTNLKNSE